MSQKFPPPEKANRPASVPEVNDFFDSIEFCLPSDIREFYMEINGGVWSNTDHFLGLWSISDLIPMNVAYSVEEFAPEFFLIGSDGGGMAFVIEKGTGRIFWVPFIPMSSNEAELIAESMKELLRKFE